MSKYLLSFIVRVNLSKNEISDLSSLLPVALGELNMSGNFLKDRDLSYISNSHILRLTLSFDFQSSQDKGKALVQFITK